MHMGNPHKHGNAQDSEATLGVQDMWTMQTRPGWGISFQK